MLRLPTGKLPTDLLRELLSKYARCDPRVVAGPSIGQDPAIIDMGDRFLVAKTDPVTFATDEIGWYAVHVNANDVACSGAVPRWSLATLLLPENSTTPAVAESIFAQLADACRELGVSLCGGHTEITHGLDRPIVVGQMLGEVARDCHLTSSGARIGDAEGKDSCTRTLSTTNRIPTRSRYAILPQMSGFHLSRDVQPRCGDKTPQKSTTRWTCGRRQR